MSDYKALMIGEKAPHFQANTTYGAINFPEDYKGKWIVFFSHPGDFTPVCTTELMTFASMSDEFAANNCVLLGLSVDSNPSHIDWSRAMEKYQWKDIKNPKITFPIVADDLGKVANLYGMLMPMASATRTVRTVFFIDPEGVIRAMLAYPLTTGRNMKEIMRLLLALQSYDKTGYATPADWMPGEAHVLPAPQTMPAASQRLDDEGKKAYYCLDWYICFTDGSDQAKMPQARVKENTTASNAVQTSAFHNINDMSDIMDMMGAAGILGRDSSVKAQANDRNMPMTSNTDKLMSSQTKPAAQSKQAGTAASANHQTMKQRGFDGGIMEQNRLLFNADNKLGARNDYMITRDYPNLGV